MNGAPIDLGNGRLRVRAGRFRLDASEQAPPSPSPADASAVQRLVEQNANAFPGKLREWALSQSLATVQSYLDAMKGGGSAPPTPASGAGETEATRERREMAARMGVRASSGPAVERRGNVMTFRPMTPEQARARIAARAGGAR